MSGIIGLVVAWLVTAVSLFIISKLPTGVEIDGFQKSMWASLAFGLCNALLRPILGLLLSPSLLILSGFLVGLILNMIIFSLAAYFVEGFRLRWGFWSALIGSVALGFINSIIYKILPI